MEEVAFCERNTRVWVGGLVVFGIAVLAYSFWVAWERGELSGFSSRSGGSHGAPAGHGAGRGHGGPAMAQGGGHGGAAMAQGGGHGGAAMAQGGGHGGAATGMTPVAFAQPAPLPQGGNAAGMVPMPVQPMDAVTRATPQGGVQFIGGTRAATLQDSFNRAAEVAQPAVVSINAIRNAAPPRPQQHPVGFLDPFDGNPDVMIGQQAYENVGAGVIVDPAGYVVTNRHVIEGASSVVVTRFSQQQEHLQARVVEIDNAADLALLQILGGAGNYPTASLADSSRIDVGDWVLAVGSPFGLEHTVTAGIVSGIRHSMTIGGIAYRNMVQTDAPINKGSSGGPLVNINGQVVGINTAIYAPTGVFNGTGFAIPSNQVGAFVSRVLEGLTGQGGWGFAPATPAPAAARPTRHENVYLGLGVIDMTVGLARRLAFPHAGGVFVSTIVMDSPADQAEISRGDIITAIDGFPIDDGQDFRAMLARLMPGQNIAVTIWRRGRTRHLHLTTATIPGAP